MAPDLANILFLDIETVAIVDAHAKLSERLKTQWARKAQYFKREENQTDEDLFNTRAGIYAEFGKVVTIAVGKFFETDSGQIGLKTRCLYSDDEKKLLNDFKSLVEKSDATALKLCAHNGKEFDFPYLSRRMLVNGITLPDVLNLSGRKPWETPHLDTMEMWKFGDYKHYTSLDLLAAIFNIPTSKTDMDGSKVNHVYHHDKDLQKIATYCTNDVVVLAQVYLSLKSQALIADSNIISG
jgi:3'-5' exonuclease